MTVSAYHSIYNWRWDLLFLLLLQVLTPAKKGNYSFSSIPDHKFGQEFHVTFIALRVELGFMLHP